LKEIGVISNYFNKISVAVVELTDTLKVGDRIKIVGGETEVEQTVDSIQIEHENIQEAKAGDSVGLKINGKVRKGYKVYRLD
jgi:putative protease